ncbi:MAG TPA: BCCT family transporter, partial [Bacteroidales bacterium]|nr:BCCT family transporter [Bacteroidales bacterium]
AWFAMLFSAGMGIGILFWGVAEPIYHYITPAMEQGETPLAAQQAINFSFLHWGLHAWGIYAMVGLALAFFAFNQKLPLSFRSVFYSLFGDRIYGRTGDVIEILAIISTVFGLATSLGFGVKQVNSGLNYLFGLPNNTIAQVFLIIGITLIATGSVVSGINSGVKKLSEINIKLAAILMLFVLIVGPTVLILDSYGQNIGNYIHNFFYNSFWTESYRGTSWQDSWTIFYWAWWISWSPFVGMFIARVSRGRTIREFVLGVLIVPTLLTFLWLTVFGGTALHFEMQGIGDIAETVQEDVSVSLYALLNQYPFAMVSNILALLLIVSFFVTSSDSGSLVVDMFASGGKIDTPVFQRIFWAFSIGAVAAVLLLGGGLNALQTAAIATGLPFTLILLVMGRSLYNGIRKEHYQMIKLKDSREKESYKDLIREFTKAGRKTEKQ